MHLNNHQKQKAKDYLIDALVIHPDYSAEEDKPLIWAKVELLLGFFPEIFCQSYEFGRVSTHYPLTELFALKAPFQLLQKVYDLCPKAAVDTLQVAIRFGVIKNDNGSRLRWLLDRAPDAAKTLCCSSHQVLPLHTLCLNHDASLEAVKCVYEAYPEGLTKKNKNGNTPVHYAMRSSSLRVVQYLVGKIDKKSKLLYEGNDDGYTPLQCAFSRSAFTEDNEAIQLFVLKTLHETLPEQKPDQNGWLPLHFACTEPSNYRTSVIKLLLEHYPDAAEVKDARGRLPVQLLLQNANLKPDVTLVEDVLCCHPGAIDAVDNAGNWAVDDATVRRFAKHMAKEKGKPQAKRQKT